MTTSHQYQVVDDGHRECAHCGLTFLTLERCDKWQRYWVKADGTVIRKTVTSHEWPQIPCRPLGA
jgi:transcriptional regulator NrdR family protein